MTNFDKGIHIVLFSAVIYIARRRRGQLYFAPVIVAMFTLSTVRVGIDIWKLILLASTGDVTENVDIPVAILHATNKYVNLLFFKKAQVRSCYAVLLPMD